MLLRKNIVHTFDVENFGRVRVESITDQCDGALLIRMICGNSRVLWVIMMVKDSVDT